MPHRAGSRWNVTFALLPVATAALALGVFVVDLATPPTVAVAALYVVVVLLATRFCRARGVVLVATGCAGFTLVAAVVGTETIISACCNITAIVVATVLALRTQSAQAMLHEQAGLLELTHDPIFVRGKDDTITYWNRGAEELYGWTREEAIGKVSHQLTQTTFPKPLEEINAELLRTGRWEGELIHRKRDGTRVTVASRWSLERDEQGRPAMVLETNNDVTEGKRAEVLTAAMFESAPDTIAVIGRDYRYRRVNPACERRWGVPAERIVGMHASELMGTEAFQQLAKPNLDRCFAGEEVTYSAWFTVPRGRRYSVVTYSPLHLNAGQIEAALLVSRDITEQMLASEALREAEAELAHVNRVTTMGQMTASIAHEVSQPIAAMITNANAGLRWLKAEPLDPEEVRQTLACIVNDGRRAGEILSRIRALVKKVPPRRDRSDLNETIRDVIALTQAECQRKGVRVLTRLADDLSAVEGDRVQVQQVILNLMVNAAEAMSGVSHRRRELTIISGEGEAGEVFVEVRDTGPGFEPGVLERLFRPFYTTKSEGLGMGLTICRSIIEAHGGRLWATPNAPHGAVFRFTLPVAANASEEREAAIT
jgi:PAS domain S-box-containing protein